MPVVNYRSGSCRNSDDALSHTYAMMDNDDLWPMCEYGWNRSDGHAFSIFRGSPGTEGDCRICRKRVAARLQPIFAPRGHRTKWI